VRDPRGQTFCVGAGKTRLVTLVLFVIYWNAIILHLLLYADNMACLLCLSVLKSD